MKSQFFKIGVHFFTLLAVCILLALIAFLFGESAEFLRYIKLADFLLNDDWNVTSEPFSFGILNILAANIIIALFACFVSFVLAFGISLFICFYATSRYKYILIHTIKILAGIPSVIYGFFALFVIVKSLENLLSLSSGESLLAGGLILSVMILPFFTAHLLDSMIKVKKRFQRDSDALGVSPGFFIRHILWRECLIASTAGFVVAFSRAVGETMATMMVIGNTPLFPVLLSKIQTIPSLIALEMGNSEVGSTHYYALIAGGCVLLCLVFIFNMILFLLERKNAKY